MLRRELKKRIIEGQLGRRLYALYPNEGPLRRELYQKHLAFFRAGKEYSERAFMGANRSGKSTCVEYESTLHLTGLYPHWWEGRRFDRPTAQWICGEDIKAVRDSLQIGFLGPPGSHGTGMIPKEQLLHVAPRQGVSEAVDSVQVRHVSGGISRGVFKTYDQGRESFQAAKIDVAVLDEEPPMPIYSETLLRTMATEPGEQNGIVMCAFTPLKGLSEVVLSYMPALQTQHG